MELTEERKAYTGPMRESYLQTLIINALCKHGFWFLNIAAGRGIRRGVPDVLACKDGCFLGIEVKTDRGRTTMLQEHEAKLLAKSGAIAVVVHGKRGVEEFKEWISTGLFSTEPLSMLRFPKKKERSRV